MYNYNYIYIIIYKRSSVLVILLKHLSCVSGEVCIRSSVQLLSLSITSRLSRREVQLEGLEPTDPPIAVKDSCCLVVLLLLLLV